jgi:hypothetical protein
MWKNTQHSQLHLSPWILRAPRRGQKIRKWDACLKATLVMLFVFVNRHCVHIPKGFSMWNNIQRSQLRLGPWNWLDLRRGQNIRKRDTSLKATLVMLFVSVSGLCVHIPREISMWNNIQRSQLHLGPWNWFDLRWGHMIRRKETFFECLLSLVFCTG